MAVTPRAMASPSGESFVVRPVGDDGDYAKVTGLASGNDIQAFGPTKGLADGTFTLTFDGHTTTSIPYTVTPPARQFIWKDLATTIGAPTQISFSVPNGQWARTVSCQIIENGLITATANFNQDSVGTGDGDFTIANTGDNLGVDPMPFRPVFLSYTPGASSISIRMTAPTVATPPLQTNWQADAVHVKVIGTGAITIYDDGFDADGDHTSFVGADTGTSGGWHEHYNGSFTQFNYGAGTESTYTIDPAAVRSALEALASVGAGNVQVTAASNRIKVEFIGALKAQAQPDITSSNPALVFTHTVGGNVPTIHVTHADSTTEDIPCRQQWEPPSNPALSWVLYAFDGDHTGFKFLPTDTITVTIPANWMTSAAGPLPAGTYAVENRFGGSLLPEFVASTKTMGVGQGVQPDPYFAECPAYINFAVRSFLDHTGPVTYKQLLEWDEDGYPTLMTDQSVFTIVTQPPTGSQDGVGGIGPLNAPKGPWTVIWDGGTGQANGLSGGANTSLVEMEQHRNLTGTTDNRMVFDVQTNSSQAAPWINWSWISSGPADDDGHWPCTTKNLRIYPPDPSDPTGMTPWLNPTGTFHPSYLAKLRTCHVVRSMQAQNVVYNPYADFDQLKQVGWLDRNSPQVTQRVAVAEVRQYTGTALNNPHVLVLKFTTVQPHGFFDGALVNLEGCGTAILSQPCVINNNLQSTLNLSNNGDLGAGLINVIDDHSFAFHALGTQNPANNNITGVTMTNVLTGGGAVNSSIGTSFPIEENVQLVNELQELYPDIPRSIWFNVPVTATDDCIDSIAAYLAAHVAAGIKVRVELGNENWNFVYQSYVWCRILNFQLFGKVDDSWEEAHAKLQLNVNTRCQAAFDSASRSDDFVHVMPTQSSSSGPTVNILNYCFAHSGRVDEVPIAPYITNYDGVAPARSNLWTAGMCLDMLELNTDDHGFDYTADNRSKIDVHYPDAKIVTYEGGPESLIPGLQGRLNSYLFSNAYVLQHAIHRHPRMYGITLRMLQSFQDDGISLYTNFYLFGGTSVEAWSAYEWWDQQTGTGDPSENPDYRNTSALTSSGQVPVVSQVAGALDYWNSLVGAEGDTLAAGTATAGSTTDTTATASATDATGGTGTVVKQWFRSDVFGQNGSPISGKTSLSLSDSGLTAGTTYYYRLKYTDANGAGSSVFSNQITLATTGGVAPVAAFVLINNVAGFANVRF